MGALLQFLHHEAAPGLATKHLKFKKHPLHIEYVTVDLLYFTLKEA